MHAYICNSLRRLIIIWATCLSPFPVLVHFSLCKETSIFTPPLVSTGILQGYSKNSSHLHWVLIIILFRRTCSPFPPHPPSYLWLGFPTSHRLKCSFLGNTKIMSTDLHWGIAQSVPFTSACPKLFENRLWKHSLIHCYLSNQLQLLLWATVDKHLPSDEQ